MTYTQRCPSCWQSWNGFAGSICNQCKIIELQKQQSEMQESLLQKQESIRRRQEIDADFAKYVPAASVNYEPSNTTTDIVVVSSTNIFDVLIFIIYTVALFGFIFIGIPYVYAHLLGII